MPLLVKSIVLPALGLFLLPLVAHAALALFEERPQSWRTADWSSARILPAAETAPEARILVFAARTGRWKGLFAVHSWIVVKPAGANRWTRYDVVGWGSPLRTNGWAPDGRWFGDRPTVVADVRGEKAEALIPRIEAAIKTYPYAGIGDYRLWPGPNSNTFVAAVLRAVPELEVVLPPTAIGKDYRPGPYIGPTDSGTGVEANLWGLFGLKLAWVEGIEFNVLGLVAGLDIRRPALKLPGFGRLGFDDTVSAAARG